MITWEKKDATIWVSKEIRVNLSPETTKRTHCVIFRIDARNTHEGFRVDRCGIMGWEAIDGGTGKANLKDSKALAERYLTQMVKQGTLTPNCQ